MHDGLLLSEKGVCANGGGHGAPGGQECVVGFVVWCDDAREGGVDQSVEMSVFDERGLARPRSDLFRGVGAGGRADERESDDTVGCLSDDFEGDVPSHACPENSDVAGVLAEDPFGHGRDGAVVAGVGQSDLPARPDGIEHRGISERRAEQRRYQDNLHVLSLAAPTDINLKAPALWL